jgi:hypothetical protein
MNCPIGRCMWKKEFSIKKCGNGKDYPYCIAWSYAKDGSYWNETTKHYDKPKKANRLKLKTNRLSLRKE